MSGDLGLHEENSIIFYTSKMTEAEKKRVEININKTHGRSKGFYL